METEAPSRPKEKMINGFPEWEAMGFADTIDRALEIKSNPKKLKAAMMVIRQRQKRDKTAREV